MPVARNEPLLSSMNQVEDYSGEYDDEDDGYGPNEDYAPAVVCG